MKKVMKKRVKRFGGEDGSFVEDEFGPTLNRSSNNNKLSEPISEAVKTSLVDGDDLEAIRPKSRMADAEQRDLRVYKPRLDIQSASYQGDDYPNIRAGDAENEPAAPAKAPKAASVKADPEKAKAIAKAKFLKDQLPAASTSSAKKSDNLAVQARADAALKRRIAQTKAQEAGGMEYHPELYLNPGRIGTKAVMEAAQALARGKGAAKAAFERVEPYMESTAPYLKEIGNSALKLGREFPKLGMKRGGTVKKMSSGGSTSKSSASSRGDGIASKGKTRGRIC